MTARMANDLLGPVKSDNCALAQAALYTPQAARWSRSVPHSSSEPRQQPGSPARLNSREDLEVLCREIV